MRQYTNIFKKLIYTFSLSLLPVNSPLLSYVSLLKSNTSNFLLEILTVIDLFHFPWMSSSFEPRLNQGIGVSNFFR